MNKEVIYRLFEIFPFTEIMFRCTLEKLPCIKKIAQKMYRKKTNIVVKKGQWDSFKNGLKSIGIKKGDIILVHSSMDGLASMGVNEEKIIDFLIALVGTEGTVVFPTYPIYSLMKKKGNKYGGKPFYDPQKTLPWTGLLPISFLTYPNVRRSLFPHNTLAALGVNADEMMNDNLRSIYSQDQYSPWQYLIDHNAKILYLGIKAHTCCTIVHYAEDVLGNQYPVENFFIKETYVIKTPDGEIIKEVSTRDEKWYRYYKMFNTGYWMKKKGYLKEFCFDGVYVGYTDNVKELADELVMSARNGKLLFNIPKKYRK